jgi:hypothetical protein
MGRRVDGEAGREAPGGEGRGVFCGSAEMGPHDLERSAPMGLGGTLGTRLTGRSIRVVSRGCAIPVAWKRLKAGEPGEGNVHGGELLTRLEGVVPSE